MDETQVVIEIPQAAYDAGAAALASGHPDHLDAASAVLRAAVPAIVAAELLRLADQLTELAEAMRPEAPRQALWVIESRREAIGLEKGITVIRERAAQLRGDA